MISCCFRLCNNCMQWFLVVLELKKVKLCYRLISLDNFHFSLTRQNRETFQGHVKVAMWKFHFSRTGGLFWNGVCDLGDLAPRAPHALCVFLCTYSLMHHENPSMSKTSVRESITKCQTCKCCWRQDFHKSTFKTQALFTNNAVECYGRQHKRHW